MNFQALDGVWPVMITPFRQNRSIDYTALEALIEWYEKRGVTGLFAVCQSSEMFSLSLRERVELATFAKKNAHVPVVASGHISNSLKDQITELRAIAETGVDAVILIVNRLAPESQPSEVWLNNLKVILKEMPENVPLGLYECPHPYKRLISLDELRFCAESGRFYFLKDTSCDTELIQKRLEVIKGSSLKLFNANTATLLDSLKMGASGFSGVMANFHPELYVWLNENWKEFSQEALSLQAGLTMCSQIERQLYPANAKYALMLDGLPIQTVCRVQNEAGLTPLYQHEIEQLRLLGEWMKLNIAVPCN